MANPIIDIRGKQIASAHIALVESFDPSKNAAVPDPERFQGRVRLIDDTSLLIEQSPSDFAKQHGLRYLGAPDHIATNPAITYRVEAFDLAKAQERNPDFRPERNFATRVSWGKGGRGESVLLENDPATVAGVVLMGRADRSPTAANRAGGERPGPKG
jgi:hypothetical protein